MILGGEVDIPTKLGYHYVCSIQLCQMHEWQREYLLCVSSMWKEAFEDQLLPKAQGLIVAHTISSTWRWMKDSLYGTSIYVFTQLSYLKHIVLYVRILV